MTQWLVQVFVRNWKKTEDESVRASYGTLSSITGIVCNVFLFSLKFAIGILVNSIAITSDAFNNLSDCMSCLITLFGYKLAAKPADKDHPFGHGRTEYIVSFVISIIIFVVGIELFKTSFTKIFHPETVTFSMPAFLLLLVSIGVKVWMSFFNRNLGRRINNQAMIATSQDSMNDVFATSATVAALLASRYTSLPVDGIAGVLVSLFILYSGYGIIKDTVSTLLGHPADKQLTTKIRNQILSHPEVIGVHDMIIHDYGPGNQIGSAHVEVDSHMEFLKAHDVVDEAEREIYENLHVMMSLHLDPVDRTNGQANAYREEVNHILRSMDPKLSEHDFRIVQGPTHTNLIFDVLIPYDCRYTSAEIKKKLDDELASQATKVNTVIVFDHDYTESPSEGD
jgi:cation diffusion facilitator family transporter